MECTRKSKANDIAFKNNFFLALQHRRYCLAYVIQKGRMVKEEEVVKDIVGGGLQNLTAGEKNPLNEYNAAFKRLQIRRKMKPVSLAALKGRYAQATTHIPTQSPQPPPTPSVTSSIASIPTA